MSTAFPRTDAESLEITSISKIPRNDETFDMDEIIRQHKVELDRYRPQTDWLLVVEDMSLRHDGLIVPVTINKRHYQFKGRIYAAGPYVKDKNLATGAVIVWGLYNGKYYDLVPGVSTWFVREIHVLGILPNADSKLSE
jgi:hypothetical protein